MNNVEDSYEILREYLKAFTNDKVLGDSPELYDIKGILIHNKIEPIISYVSNGCKSPEYPEWEKNKVFNFNRISSCIKIFENLENLKIPYAIIKGAYLDKLAYKNMGLRFSYDIDFLIEKKNYKRLHKLMLDCGFIAGEWNAKEKKIDIASRESVLYNFIYTHQSAPYVKIEKYNGYEQDISVDLNFSISWGEDEQGNSLTSQLLEDTQVVEYENIKYRVLNPETFLVQICMHSYRDMNTLFLIKTGKFKLRLLCDVFYYIFFNLDKLNADKFIDICKQCNYEKYIYYVLYYTTEVFDNFPWIDYVMKCIKMEDVSFLNKYGISTDEIKQWPISFHDRVVSSNLFDIISSSLTERDIKKLNIIADNIQHQMK
jgi:hypothetical protein